MKPEHEDSQAAETPWLNQRNYQNILDERIRAAEAAGLFNNLAGAGKPLKFDDDRMVPEEDRTAYRMLKNAGFGPPWLELKHQIAEEQAKLERWHVDAARRQAAATADAAALRSELEALLRDINRLINSYNMMVPPVIGQLPLLQLWRELQKLERQAP